MPDIEHSLIINAKSERIWPALTTAKGVGGWWTVGGTLVNGDFGQAGEFRFQSRGIHIRMQVVALNRPTHVTWRPLEANAPGGWNGTTITFDLAADGDATQLTFAHLGFAKDSEGYRRVTGGWAHYLQNLKQLAETGARDPANDHAVKERCE